MKSFLVQTGYRTKISIKRPCILILTIPTSQKYQFWARSTLGLDPEALGFISSYWSKLKKITSWVWHPLLINMTLDGNFDYTIEFEILNLIVQVHYQSLKGLAKTSEFPTLCHCWCSSNHEVLIAIVIWQPASMYRERTILYWQI